MSTAERFQTKAIEGFEIKSEARGEVVAVVSTMNVVDREGDVILSGAIRDGSAVKLSAYEHDVITEGKAPVGHGVVNIEGDRAVLRAKYLLSTERGRDAFETVKAMESEWSIGFSKNVKTAPMTDGWKAQGARRLIAGLDLLEASPVFRAANGMTGTLEAKAAAAAVKVVDAAEDAWLRSIYDRHVLPLELRARYGDGEAIREESDLKQLAQRSFDREMTRPDSYEPPADFDTAIDFARASIGLDARALPAPRLVRPGTLKDAQGKRTRGVFLVVKGAPRIFLEDTGDADQMAHTFLHEASHARQQHYGDPMTESDACAQADALFAAWQRERGGQ